MKKLAIFITLFAVLMTFSVGQAQSPRAGLNAETGAFTFQELGYEDILLIGPYDSSSMYFSLPPTWALTEGGKINLTYSHIYSSGIVDDNANRVGGTLLVFFNGQLIDTLVLETNGMTTVEIDIPQYAYGSKPDDGRQDIGFFLDARTICDYDDAQSSVFIHGLSTVDFAYNLVPPPTDLGIFPRPIFQQDSLVPNRTKIVIPDEPTATELQAALSVGTGLASISENEIDLELLQSSNLTDEILSSEHLIFVGQASKFPNVAGLRFPISPSSSGLSYDGLEEDDGVVQTAISNWDPDHIMMMVTGNSDAGVLKAAEAVSTGMLVPSVQKDLAIVSGTSSPRAGEPVAEDVTLSELGVETFTLGNYNGNYFSLDFYVSSEQVFSEDAYFEFVATYSSLMDESRTGITIFLNDITAGNVSIDQDTDDVLKERIEFLPNMLRRGRNTLTFYTDLVPADNCYNPDLDATWMTISGESALHLPTADRKINLGANINLTDFPGNLIGDEALENLAVILPKNDLASWNSALQITALMGARAATPIVRLTAAYADDVPENVLEEKNLVVVGQASMLPIISDLNEFLPAPFPEDSDNAEQPSLLVNYRLLPNVSVGYLQLLPSPWNLDNTILTVMGNSDIGTPMAAQALLNEDTAVQLVGNFSILYGSQVLSTDTRLGPARDGLTAEMPEETLMTEEENKPEPAPTQSDGDLVVTDTPKWLIPVAGVSTLLILIVLIFLIRRASASRIKNK